MRVLFSLLLSAAIIAGSAGLVAVLSKGRADESAQSSSQDSKPVNVRVTTLSARRVEDTLLLTGRVDAWEDITVSAEVSGNVEWQGVDDGTRVAGGDELFRIDTSWYQAEYTQAMAQAALAVQELNRVDSLRKNGISSPQELDRAETERKVSEANVTAAATRLEKSIVKAPITGVIDEVLVKAGEWADTGKPLARIVQTDRVKVVVGVPERDIPHFRAKDEVSVTLDALPGESLPGHIFRIATTAERETRTFSTEIELPNESHRLRPGMVARVRMVRNVFPDAISVPIFSVLTMENQRFALVVENGVARIRQIQVGVLEGDRVHVTEGLRPGDTLIIAGHRDLRDGQPVTITEEVPE